jgi:hypothetical protein
MDAFLLTGWTSQWHQGQIADACVSVILFGGGKEEAMASFEEQLLAPTGSESSAAIKIEKVICAPVFNELFTEERVIPINWPEICEEAERILQDTQPDDLAQGYWVDCDQTVPPGRLSANIDSLKIELPEDIRSNLNWSGDKAYFFLVSVFSAPKQPADFYEDQEQVELNPNEDESTQFAAEPRVSPFPELVDKDLVVLIRARNSVIAAWLWRKHALSTTMATNRISIGPWCGAYPVDQE